MYGHVYMVMVRIDITKFNFNDSTISASQVTMILCAGLRYGSSCQSLRSSALIRRFLQHSAHHAQAFLEPIASHPGIVCLSLNRPQTKNAISLTLLQVNTFQSTKYTIEALVHSNSEKA